MRKSLAHVGEARAAAFDLEEGPRLGRPEVEPALLDERVCAVGLETQAHPAAQILQPEVLEQDPGVFEESRHAARRTLGRLCHEFEKQPQAPGLAHALNAGPEVCKDVCSEEGARAIDAHLAHYSGWKKEAASRRAASGAARNKASTPFWPACA